MKHAGLGGILVVMAAVVFAAGGCVSAKHKTPTGVAALQGSWEGKEVGSDNEGPCRLTISGNQLEFRGSHPSEWYKGTFTTQPEASPQRLVGLIQDCPLPAYVGKHVQAIYKIDGRTLTLTGSEPGRPEIPADFEASGTRTFVLRKL